MDRITKFFILNTFVSTFAGLVLGVLLTVTFQQVQPVALGAQAPQRIFGTDSTTGTATPLLASAGVLNTTCDSQAAISGATITTTSLVPVVAGKRAVACGFVATGAGATTFKLVYGTGAACGTGTTDLTGAMTLASGTTIPYEERLRTPVANGICWVNTAVVQVSGVLTYGYQ